MEQVVSLVGVGLDDEVLEEVLFKLEAVALGDVACFLFGAQGGEEGFFEGGGEDLLRGAGFESEGALVEEEEGGVALGFGGGGDFEGAFVGEVEDFGLGVVCFGVGRSDEGVDDVEPAALGFFEGQVAGKEGFEIGRFKEVFLEVEVVVVADGFEGSELLFLGGFVLVEQGVEQFPGLAGGEVFLAVGIGFFVARDVLGELVGGGRRCFDHLFCDLLEEEGGFFAVSGEGESEAGAVGAETAAEAALLGRCDGGGEEVGEVVDVEGGEDGTAGRGGDFRGEDVEEENGFGSAKFGGTDVVSGA